MKYKIFYERLAFNVKVDSGSTFTFNASHSYNLLCFIYACKASQIHVRNLCKIYATAEIHLKAPRRFFSLQSTVLGWVGCFLLMGENQRMFEGT